MKDAKDIVREDWDKSNPDVAEWRAFVEDLIKTVFRNNKSLVPVLWAIFNHSRKLSDDDLCVLLDIDSEDTARKRRERLRARLLGHATSPLGRRADWSCVLSEETGKLAFKRIHRAASQFWHEHLNWARDIVVVLPSTPFFLHPKTGTVIAVRQPDHSGDLRKDGYTAAALLEKTGILADRVSLDFHPTGYFSADDIMSSDHLMGWLSRERRRNDRSDVLRQVNRPPLLESSIESKVAPILIGSYTANYLGADLVPNNNIHSLGTKYWMTTFCERVVLSSDELSRGEERALQCLKFRQARNNSWIAETDAHALCLVQKGFVAGEGTMPVVIALAANPAVLPGVIRLLTDEEEFGTVLAAVPGWQGATLLELLFVARIRAQRPAHHGWQTGANRIEHAEPFTVAMESLVVGAQ